MWVEILIKDLFLNIFTKLCTRAPVKFDLLAGKSFAFNDHAYSLLREGAFNFNEVIHLFPMLRRSVAIEREPFVQFTRATTLEQWVTTLQ